MLIRSKSDQLTLMLTFRYRTHRCSIVSKSIDSIWVTEIFLFGWISYSVLPSVVAPSAWHYIDGVILQVSTYSHRLSRQIVRHNFLHASVLHPLLFLRIMSSSVLVNGIVFLRFEIIFFSISRAHGGLRLTFGVWNFLRQNGSCRIRSTS